MTQKNNKPSLFFRLSFPLQTLIFFVLFAVIYILLRLFVLEPGTNNYTYSNDSFSINNENIPLLLEFCGEKIPSNNNQILHDLKSEFLSDAYWKTSAGTLYAKAERWFPYIEPILKQEGVPDDFKYVAVIESHLSNVHSAAGAAGFWQLVTSSAKNYGLEVNEYVDERLDVELSTKVACKHFKEAYAIFNNWTLAAAAYNRGIGGIQKALESQDKKNYYQLLLNKETGSFIYRILAYKTLFSNPSNFGLHKSHLNYLPKIQYKEYKVDSALNSMKYFCAKTGCDQNILLQHNPWLLRPVLPNPGNKIYRLKVPKNIKRNYSAYLNDLNPAVNSDVLPTVAEHSGLKDSLHSKVNESDQEKH